MFDLMQLFGSKDGGGAILNMVYLFLLMAFIFLGPRIYLWQALAKIEASALKLEKIAADGRKDIFKAAGKYGGKGEGVKHKVDNFMDFFMIPPVDLDPFGIMKKLEHLVRGTEGRFKQAAEQIAPKADSEEVMNVYMGLQAAVTINMIAKIVRHWAELMKKFKNFQFALLFQMQLPMIEKIVEAEQKGLKAFLNGEAIGDAAGPLVIASLTEKEGKEIARDVIAVQKPMWGRNLILLKARGPGGRLGELGYAVENAVRRNKKVAKIITIDAAQKLEGEKTGSVAEGIGVAIGGIGIEKAKIEEIALRHKLPLDAIAIKMSPFEAISPMPAEVADGVKKAVELLKERVEDVPKGAKVVVVGVGNTCGIPNTNKGLKEVVKKIKSRAKKLKAEEKSEDAGWLSLPKGKKGKDDEGAGLIGNFINFLFVKFGMPLV